MTARTEVPILADYSFSHILFLCYLCVKYVQFQNSIRSINKVESCKNRTASNVCMRRRQGNPSQLHCPQFVIGMMIALHCEQAHKVQFYQDIFRLPNVLRNSDMLGILHGIISHTFSPDVRGLLEQCMTNQGSGKWAMISFPGFLE